MRPVTAQSAARKPASSISRAVKGAEQPSGSSQAVVREFRTCSALPGFLPVLFLSLGCCSPYTPAMSLNSNTPCFCSPLCLACTSLLLHLANAHSSLEMPLRCHLLQKAFSDCSSIVSRACPIIAFKTHQYDHLLSIPLPPINLKTITVLLMMPGM